MFKDYKLVLFREDTSWNEKAAQWFHEKWKVPVEAYLESMEECQKLHNKVPQWYMLLDGENIVAGMGAIANDFHKRTDLTPNLCAVYVDERYRGQGIARDMMAYICEDLQSLGYPDMYLITTHTEFYERCGWEFYCMVEEDDGGQVRMYHYIGWEEV